MRSVFPLLWCLSSCNDGLSPGREARGAGCEDLPAYAYSELDCNQLAYALERTIDEAAGCVSDSDCRILHPPCEQWPEIECYYAVNSCFDDALLQEYDIASSDCAVMSGMTFTGCYCGSAPAVRCETGRCVSE